jgi:hypothetical protein
VCKSVIAAFFGSLGVRPWALVDNEDARRTVEMALARVSLESIGERPQAPRLRRLDFDHRLSVAVRGHTGGLCAPVWVERRGAI